MKFLSGKNYTDIVPYFQINFILSDWNKIPEIKIIYE